MQKQPGGSSHAQTDRHRRRHLSLLVLSLAPLSSTAFAQDKAGAPAAKSGDTMSKGDDMSKDKMGKTTKKAKKTSKMKSDDAMKQ